MSYNLSFISFTLQFSGIKFIYKAVGSSLLSCSKIFFIIPQNLCLLVRQSDHSLSSNLGKLPNLLYVPTSTVYMVSKLTFTIVNGLAPCSPQGQYLLTRPLLTIFPNQKEYRQMRASFTGKLLADNIARYWPSFPIPFSLQTPCFPSRNHNKMLPKCATG